MWRTRDDSTYVHSISQYIPNDFTKTDVVDADWSSDCMAWVCEWALCAWWSHVLQQENMSNSFVRPFETEWWNRITHSVIQITIESDVIQAKRSYSTFLCLSLFLSVPLSFNEQELTNVIVYANDKERYRQRQSLHLNRMWNFHVISYSHFMIE